MGCDLGKIGRQFSLLISEEFLFIIIIQLPQNLSFPFFFQLFNKYLLSMSLD